MLLLLLIVTMLSGWTVADRSYYLPGCLNWIPFSVSERAEISPNFQGQSVERYYVKYPCQESIWFKLFLSCSDGQNSHVEIFNKEKGNIYCNGAGRKNWWGGEKTDFTMAKDAMKCEPDGKSLIIEVEKTVDRVTIKNQGKVLYNQAFTENDAKCRNPTSSVKTQTWKYQGWLSLAVFDDYSNSPGCVNWVPFSVSKKAEISTDFSNEDMERFTVSYPCTKDSVWFKLFLNRADGQNAHIELFSKEKGNIYCNGAGRKNWWGGEKTDFTMAKDAMKCEPDGKFLVIEVEKTADSVTIKNRGKVLYTQAFTEKDANCRQPTTKVSTQVWNYQGWLALSVFDNSSPRTIGLNWIPFSVSNKAELSTDFSNQKQERFFVRYPCKDSIWFKLFLYRAAGQNAHVEIFSKEKGNIYCNGAGRKNWWGGEKTDFTIAKDAMKCEADGKYLVIEVEKTADSVSIKNQGEVLYSQDITANDANCRQPTTKVTTQVWNYDGWLNLAVLDNSFQ